MTAGKGKKILRAEDGQLEETKNGINRDGR